MSFKVINKKMEVIIMSLNYKAFEEIEAEAIAELKRDVSSIKCTSNGINKSTSSSGLRIMTVSMSTIRKNNYILCPEYYDTESQINKICREIDKKNGIHSVVSFLNKIVREKKLDGAPVNSELVASLTELLRKSKALQGVG